MTPASPRSPREPRYRKKKLKKNRIDDGDGPTCTDTHPIDEFYDCMPSIITTCVEGKIEVASNVVEKEIVVDPVIENSELVSQAADSCVKNKDDDVSPNCEVDVWRLAAACSAARCVRCGTLAHLLERWFRACNGGREGRS